MAPQKSPAFQFYAKDFLAGTASMSLLERGAYVTLLAYEWDAGSVPDSARDRARILGCTSGQEKSVWSVLAKKFVLKGDAYINERLEEEREKQAEYRRRQSDKGRASAATRQATKTQPDGNRGSTVVEPALQPEGQPKGNSSSSSSSSSTQEVIGSPTTKHRGGGLIVGGGEYVRLLETHAYVGAKLRVPKVLHAELMTKSGANADAELRDWYARLDEQLENDGKGTGDVFAWLRPRHQQFALQQGWIDAAPKANGTKPSDADQLAKLEAIARGERVR